ncbi:hypothetical protein VLI64_001329 [Listeria monocytogenes]|nr:hypothetical protein [Listeria monocytogenes]HDU1203437.1 hypothetical protein [Listeria monocytogenes]
MVYMHKKGYGWGDGTPLTPIKYERWEEYGRGTYVMKNYKSRTLRQVTIGYINKTTSLTILPYIEKTNYVGYYEPVKRDLNAEILTEKESRIIKKKAFDALVNHRIIRPGELNLSNLFRVTT